MNIWIKSLTFSGVQASTRRTFLRSCGSIGAMLATTPLIAQVSRKTILDMARAAEKLDGVGVIDSHAHILEQGGDAGLINPQSEDSLVEDMDRCGIRVAVFSNRRGYQATSAAAVAAAHEESAYVVKAHPERLRSYVTFQPHFLEASLKETERLLQRDSGFVGFKLHGAVNEYPATGPNYRPVFQFAHEHHLPVLFHVKGDVSRVVDEFSGMTLIMAHLSPGEERAPQLLKGRPNLYIDTCLTTGGYRQIERMAAAVGPERLLFATDATFNNVGAAVAKIAFTRLPDEDKRLILGGNARRIFKGLPGNDK